MKVVSDHLFVLIKSLSRNEKGYFKKYASLYTKGRKNNYLCLFDAIDRLEEYDEKAVRNQFGGEKFIRHLASEKNHLYYLLLRSLRSYHSVKNQDIKLREMIDYVAVLYDKALYGHCEVLLKTLFEKTDDAEKFLLAAEVCNWKKNLIRQQGKLLEPEKRDKLYDSIFRNLEKESNNREYDKLNDELFYYIRKEGGVRKGSALKKIKSLLKTPLVKNEKFAVSINSRALRFNMMAAYHYFTGDDEKGYFFCKKFLDVARLEYKMNNNPDGYISALANFAIMCLPARRYFECESVLEELKNLPAENPHRHLKNRILYITTCLKLYIAQGRFEKGEELLKDAEFLGGTALLKEWGHKPSYLHMIYYISYLCFCLGKYSEALRWLNIFFNSCSREDSMLNVYSHAKILNLIIHYEKGDEDALEHSYRSTFRFLYKQQRLYKLETIVLVYLKRLSHPRRQEDLMVLFSEMKTRIAVLHSDPIDKRAFQYFDFTEWLESKTSKTSLQTLFRRRAEK